MNALVAKYRYLDAKVSYMLQSRSRREYGADCSFTEAVAKYAAREDLYSYMHHYLHHVAPSAVREHRAFFKSSGRGFGEDAFHAMWYTLLREFRPKSALEIGIYRGQTISLWALIAKLCDFSVDVHGISPFTAAGDSVSKYSNAVDYLEDTLDSHRKFMLPIPVLVRAYSTDSTALAHIRERKWDLIYIDGNHDFDVVLADYQVCKQALAPNGLLVFDDASLYSGYRPPKFGFAGHPGPSKVVQEFAMSELKFLGSVGHNNVFRNMNR